MNTREIATDYRLTHWAGIMRQRQESGLSIKLFCESSGFHENVYFYWQRKLREAACQTLLPAARDTAAPKGWAMVCEAAKPEPERSAVTIEIGKSRITATSEVDPELLSRVCRVLVSLC